MTQNTLQSAGLADLLTQAQANEAQGAASAAPVQQPALTAPVQVASVPPVAQVAPVPLPGLPGSQPIAQVAPVNNTPAIPPGAIEVELSEPVSTRNGVMVDIIYLRQPTLGDWLDCGDLMQAQAIEGDGGTPKVDVRVDPQAAAKWFTKLSGQPMRYFRSMNLKDWRRIMNHLQQLAGDAGGENPMM